MKSSNPAPDGQAFTRQPLPRTWRPKRTTASLFGARKCYAANATRTWGMCSPMVRNPPVNVTASIRRRCALNLRVTKGISRIDARGASDKYPNYSFRLNQNILNHFAEYIRQTEIPAGIAVGQLGVIHAELIEQGRVQVVNRDTVLDGLESEF